MERPLVVTGPSESAMDLIREAGELAEATETPLTVLTVVTREEFEEDSETLSTIGEIEHTSHSFSAEEYAESVAKQAINDLLADLDVETEPVGVGVSNDGARADAIIEAAEERDCDYVFVIGRRRSPTGKAVFGDTAQKVILNYDGSVVVKTE